MKPDTMMLSGFAAGGEVEVPCDQIDVALDDLWRGIAAKVAERRFVPDAAFEGMATVHRACLLNLVIHAGDTSSEVVSRFLASSITDRFPARIVLIRARPELGGHGVPPTFVAVSRRPDGESHGEAVSGELVRIDARGDQLDRVPAIVRASLEPDVTTALWWTGRIPPTRPYVAGLRDLADRILVDSDSLPDDADVSHLLPHRADARVADLAWPRLAPWRSAIARAFDEPAHRGFLRNLRAVRIGLGVVGGAAPVASAAPLLAGWLAAALGWAPCERSVALDQTETPCRAVRFASGGRRGCDVTVSTYARPSRHEGIVSVDLVAAGPGGAAVEMRFARTDAGNVTIDVPPGFAPVRPPLFRELDAADVLGATLLESSADPIAPAAIRRAAEIAAALSAT